MIEAYYDVMQDLLFSEYVWLYLNSDWQPDTVTKRSLLKKTSVNDRLIQYTIEVQEANDIINNVL